MKIDLHCHTLSVKNGENKARNTTKAAFRQKVLVSGVEAIAITNHNLFDTRQFKSLTKEVADICQLWAGVELDIVAPDSRKYHMLVICSPTKADIFSEQLTRLMKAQTPETFASDVIEVINSFEKLDCVFVPHFHKKPAITEAEIKRIESALSNKHRLILESQNILSMGILINHGMSSIVGSDIQDWEKYPNKELPELRLRVDSYEQFCQLLDKDPIVVKTLLDKKTHTKLRVNPCDDNHELTAEEHVFYYDINVIMGDKGTGKTEVIKSLKRYFDSQGVKCSVYISGETKDELSRELETDDMERSTAKIGIDNCTNDFELIRNWSDRQPSTTRSYIMYCQSRTNRAQQRRIQWSRLSRVKTNDISSALEKTKNDLQLVRNAQSSLGNINIEAYLNAQDINTLKGLLVNLAQSIEEKLEQNIIEKYAIRLTNYTLDKFKDRTSAKTNTAPKPDNTGFEEYALNRLALDSAVSKILTAFTAPSSSREYKDYELMGSIGDKGRIFLEKRYRLLQTDGSENEKSKYTEFNGTITSLKDAKDCLKKIASITLDTNQKLFDELDELRRLMKKADIESLDDFVGISKHTVNDEHEVYHLSNGERSILYMQRALSDETEVYLLDEPELSMANSYIDEVVRPKLIDLGRKNKMVIMATHNANLAVRTLPYFTMYRHHGVSGYKTYVGNPFSNSLVNIKDLADKLDWRETSIKILEGSREAFSDRKEIYG